MTPFFSKTDCRFIPSEGRTEGLMVLLPCMGGNILAYRFPLSLWTKMGYSIFLFNPPGHGKSAGVFSFEESVSLLQENIVRIEKDIGIHPLTGIGHSGGGSGLLGFFSQFPEHRPERIFLLSPILDTAGSLQYLYKNNNIIEFINSLKIKNKKITDVLFKDEWLDKNIWENESLREKLNFWASESKEIYTELGTFLENVFIPSRKFHSLMEKFSERTVLFLPRQDIWYPMEDSIVTAARSGIRHRIIQTAENHFFRNGWKDIGKEITSFLES